MDWRTAAMIGRTSTVLFAGRNVEWVRPLKTMLEKDGVRVLTADSTREAIALAGEAAPGIVVVEKDLQPIATSSFLDALRCCAPPPDLILVSADADPNSDDLRRGMNLLYDAAKPVDVFRLYDVISSALRRRANNPDPLQDRHSLILCVDDDSLYLTS